jgi:hypothetical protein
MKKLLIVALLAAGLLSSALADSFTWVIAPNTITNILPAPVKLTSLSVVATNAVTFNIYDAPGTVFTNNVGAYSNLVQYATNVSVIYTNFFGASNGYIMTNVMVTATNSVAGRSISYPLIFSQSVGSNTTANLGPLSLSFVNGVMLTNNSANTLSLTVGFTGN